MFVQTFLKYTAEECGTGCVELCSAGLVLGMRSLLSRTAHQYCSSDKIEKNEIDRGM
jgi:hypothetical protein